MWNKTVVTASAALCLALSGGTASAIEELTSGEVRYITGGVGENEKRELLDRASQFSLRIVTARKANGDFLADCKVTIQRGEQTVLEAVMDGPILMARLPPGSYRVRTEFEGRAQERPVNIAPKSLMNNLYLYW